MKSDLYLFAQIFLDIVHVPAVFYLSSIDILLYVIIIILLLLGKYNKSM